MKFQFTKFSPKALEIIYAENASDYQGAGKLMVTLETTEEIESAFNGYLALFGQRPILEMAKLATELPYTFTALAKDKRPWFKCGTVLPVSWLEPYTKWMDSALMPGTAIADRLDALAMDIEVSKPRHTHIVVKTWLNGLEVFSEGFTQSQPWNNKTAQVYADSCYDGYIKEYVGTRFYEPQYIPAGKRGTMICNPKYGQSRLIASMDCKAVLEKLTTYWISDIATDAQKDILRRVMLLQPTTNVAYELKSGSFYYEEKGGTVNWSKDKEVTHMNREAFRNLK